MTLPKLNNLCAKMTTTDFKLTRTATKQGKQQGINPQMQVSSSSQHAKIP